MNALLRHTVYIGGIGFITAFAGTFTGMILSFALSELKDDIRGFLLSLISGLMIALVCFDLLPEGIKSTNKYVVTLGMAAGLVSSILLEKKSGHGRNEGHGLKLHKYSKAAAVMALAVGIHNIPAGMALGSIWGVSAAEGYHMSAALVLHGIPEGFAMGIYYREGGAGILKMTALSVLTSCPMGIGALLGNAISTVSYSFSSFGLGFAGAMILYITFRETLSDARDFSGEDLSTIGSMIGVIIGVLLIFHNHMH